MLASSRSARPHCDSSGANVSAEALRTAAGVGSGAPQAALWPTGLFHASRWHSTEQYLVMPQAPQAFHGVSSAGSAPQSEQHVSRRAKEGCLEALPEEVPRRAKEGCLGAVPEVEVPETATSSSSPC